MGNVVRALGKFAVRKSRRFNIESRTDRFLEKNVKNPPPKPLATQKEIEMLRQELPNLMDEIQKPNPALLNHLKDVYVSSHDPPPDKAKSKINPDRPLPLQRKTVMHEEYGYVEPDSVSPGRLSLKQALQLLSKHQLDKTTNTAEKLAVEYNLSPKDVGNFVEYFKLYTLVDLKPDVIGFDAKTFSTDPNDNIGINIITMKNYMALLKPKADKKITAGDQGSKEMSVKGEGKEPTDKK